MPKSTQKRSGRPPSLVAEKNAIRRSSAIIRVIEKHPGIHHRKLLELIIKEMHLMAKPTAEGIIKNLVSMNILETARNEEDARMLHYYLTYRDEINYAKLEQALQVNSSIIDAEIGRLQKEYRRTNLDEKIWFTTWLLKLLFGTLDGYNLLAAIRLETNPSAQEELRLKSNMRRTFEIIRKDKDYKFVFPLVRSSILNSSALNTYR